MERAGDLDAIRRRIERGDTVTVLDTCRSIVARMQDRENQIFERHQKLAGAARDSVAFAIFAITAFAVLMLVLVAYVVFRDATTQRESRRALLESEAALREADQRKDVFLAILSHELRNPLAPIRNAARLLEAPTLTDDELQRSRTIISRQVRHMASLLDDLLDVSRITQGRIVLKRRAVLLAEIIAQAMETVEPLIAEKRHEISVVSYRPLRVYADPTRLVQCVVNILTNAAKYTQPHGTIRVQTAEEADEAVLTITDNGPGISPDLLPHIFDLFVQSERTLDRSQGGLGIGLSLVKRLIEMHGGRVAARSPGAGEGSTFEVRLPLSKQAVEPAREAPHAVPGRRILVVDDNADAADSLGSLLQLEGHTVVVTYTSAGALAQLAEFKPDIVLLDIGLPEAEDRQRAKASGFDAHLVKPVEFSALQRALAAQVSPD
jgi:signal transduction histidine kinase